MKSVIWMGWSITRGVNSAVALEQAVAAGYFFFFQAEDGIRDFHVTGVQTCALPIWVTGDSMIDAGILNGDYIFVRKQPTADRGDIVVALIGDEATVKYYYPEKDYIRFQPANGQMAPILVRAADFKPTMLLGVVVGVYRRL